MKPDGDDAIFVDGKVINVVTLFIRIHTKLIFTVRYLHYHVVLNFIRDLGIDLVIEGTGVFVDKEGAGKQFEAGA